MGAPFCAHQVHTVTGDILVCGGDDAYITSPGNGGWGGYKGCRYPVLPSCMCFLADSVCQSAPHACSAMRLSVKHDTCLPTTKTVSINSIRCCPQLLN
jgi:hypothetical protein